MERCPVRSLRRPYVPRPSGCRPVWRDGRSWCMTRISDLPAVVYWRECAAGPWPLLSCGWFLNHLHY